jgi:ACS family hexuronate transporter-like MFS transporter
MGGYRWVVCALLFAATTVNYIDRQILALIKEFLDKELGWSNETFGWVNGVFQLAYAVGLLAFGRFVDRYGTKIGYAVSIAMWSIAAISHAAVGSIGGFFAARTFLGVSEGGNFPSAIKAVALWFPRRERALATSIFNAGTNVGAIIAPMMIPAIAIHFGWRSTFVLAGLAGFLWLFFWFPMYDVPEKRKDLDPAELAFIRSDKDEGAAGGRPIGELRALRRPQTWSFITAKFFTDPVWWFFLIWLPDYFRATRGLDIKHSWVLIVTIYTIVTVLSIAGGWVTGWLTTRARRGCSSSRCACSRSWASRAWATGRRCSSSASPPPPTRPGPRTSTPRSPTCSPRRTWPPSSAWAGWRGPRGASCSPSSPAACSTASPPPAT